MPHTGLVAGCILLNLQGTACAFCAQQHTVLQVLESSLHIMHDAHCQWACSACMACVTVHHMTCLLTEWTLRAGTITQTQESSRQQASQATIALQPADRY